MRGRLMRVCGGLALLGVFGLGVSTGSWRSEGTPAEAREVDGREGVAPRPSAPPAARATPPERAVEAPRLTGRSGSDPAPDAGARDPAPGGAPPEAPADAVAAGAPAPSASDPAPGLTPEQRLARALAEERYADLHEDEARRAAREERRQRRAERRAAVEERRRQAGRERARPSGPPVVEVELLGPPLRGVGDEEPRGAD